MSTPRRLILIAVAALIALAGIFVPFEVVDRGTHIAAGYGWVFAPPDPVALINIRQVIAEWLGVLLIGAILWLLVIPRTRSIQSIKDRHIELGPKAHSENPDANLAGRSNVEHGATSQKMPGIRWAYAAGIFVVAFIAFGSLAWREVSRAASPVSPVEFCDFAAKSAMVEQWTFADNTVDPLRVARTLFGPNAKRRWTVEEAEKFGDMAKMLRSFVMDNARAQAAVRTWLEAMPAGSKQELLQREYIQRLLINHCVYGQDT